MRTCTCSVNETLRGCALIRPVRPKAHCSIELRLMIPSISKETFRVLLSSSTNRGFHALPTSSKALSVSARTPELLVICCKKLSFQPLSKVLTAEASFDDNAYKANFHLTTTELGKAPILKTVLSCSSRLQYYITCRKLAILPEIAALMLPHYL